MNEKWSGGKGDCRRPHNQQVYDAGYEMIFNTDPEERERYRIIWRDLLGKDHKDYEPTPD